MHLCTCAYSGAWVAACTTVNECGETSVGTRESTTVQKQKRAMRSQAMGDNIDIDNVLAFARPDPICVHHGGDGWIGLQLSSSLLDRGNGEGLAL